MFDAWQYAVCMFRLHILFRLVPLSLSPLPFSKFLSSAFAVVGLFDCRILPTIHRFNESLALAVAARRSVHRIHLSVYVFERDDSYPTFRMYRSYKIRLRKSNALKGQHGLNDSICAMCIFS